MSKDEGKWELNYMNRFCLFMGPDCCSLLAGKKCPVDSGEKDDDVYSCYGMAERLKENGWDSKQEFFESYAIVSHPCGRYTISSGQHRFCIMQRENIEIPDVYEKQEGPCGQYNDICEKYLRKVNKNLYISDSAEYVVDEDGKEIYSEQVIKTSNIFHRLWSTIKKYV